MIHTSKGMPDAVLDQHHISIKSVHKLLLIWKQSAGKNKGNRSSYIFKNPAAIYAGHYLQLDLLDFISI